MPSRQLSLLPRLPLRSPNLKHASSFWVALMEQPSRELKRATGWQAHSVRGFLSGALKKRMRLCIMSDKAAGGERRYRISAPTRS